MAWHRRHSALPELEAGLLLLLLLLLRPVQVAVDVHPRHCQRVAEGRGFESAEVGAGAGHQRSQALVAEAQSCREGAAGVLEEGRVGRPTAHEGVVEEEGEQTVVADADAVAAVAHRLAVPARWALVQLLDRTYFARAQLLVEHHMRQQRQQATASVDVQVAAQPSMQTQHGNSGLRQPLLPPVPSLMRGNAR